MATGSFRTVTIPVTNATGARSTASRPPESPLDVCGRVQRDARGLARLANGLTTDLNRHGSLQAMLSAIERLRGNVCLLIETEGAE